MRPDPLYESDTDARARVIQPGVNVASQSYELAASGCPPLDPGADSPASSALSRYLRPQTFPEAFLIRFDPSEMFQLLKHRHQMGFATQGLRLQSCKNGMVTGI